MMVKKRLSKSQASIKTKDIDKVKMQIITTSKAIRKRVVWEMMCDELPRGFGNMPELKQTMFKDFFERNWKSCCEGIYPDYMLVKHVMSVWNEGGL